jgi:hypothetical protein
MLGLLKTEGAEENVQRIQIKNSMGSMGQAFALCCYDINYRKNYSFLETSGMEIQDAGGARSLSNLNAIILMSLLGDKRFPAYAESLRNKTQETFQREAIDAAIRRHGRLINKSSKITRGPRY